MNNASFAFIFGTLYLILSKVEKDPFWIAVFIAFSLFCNALGMVLCVLGWRRK